MFKSINSALGLFIEPANKKGRQELVAVKGTTILASSGPSRRRSSNDLLRRADGPDYPVGPGSIQLRLLRPSQPFVRGDLKHGLRAKRSSISLFASNCRLYKFDKSLVRPRLRAPFSSLFEHCMSTTLPLLAQQIHHAVIHNPHLNHRKMHIKTKQGRVVIEGTVESFFEKQMAQEALRNIEGVETIENQLTVTWS